MVTTWSILSCLCLFLCRNLHWIVNRFNTKGEVDSINSEEVVGKDREYDDVMEEYVGGLSVFVFLGGHALGVGVFLYSAQPTG